MRLFLLRLVLFSIVTGSWASAAEVDKETGLVIAPGFETVSVQCTVCHSARLITQNRADHDGWLAMIRWMQDSQGLWPLGDQEEPILGYLSTNYGPATSNGPSAAGRRRALAAELLPPR